MSTIRSGPQELLAALSYVRLGWFHRYPARFGASVALEIFEGALKRFGGTPSLILDPFCGTGTTLAVAKQIGLPSIGIELTPLGAVIAKTRLSNVDPGEATVLIDEWSSRKYKRVSVPRELVDWIGATNAAQVSGILCNIKRLNDVRLRRLLMVIVSASLRPSSDWLSGSVKPQVDPHRDYSPIGPHLKRIARAISKDIERERAADVMVPAEVICGDATRLPLRTGIAEVVISSPPYFTTYDYFDVQRLSNLAFGWASSQRQVGRSSGIPRDGVGFRPPRSMKQWYVQYRKEETVDGRALRAYAQGMRVNVQQIFDVLRPGGVVAYAVANSVRSGRPFTLTRAVADLLREAGFVHVESVKRETSNRRILPSARDPQSGRFTGGADHAVDERIVYAVRP